MPPLPTTAPPTAPSTAPPTAAAAAPAASPSATATASLAPPRLNAAAAQALRHAIEREARGLGFDAIGISGIELAEDERHLLQWL